MSAKIYLLVLLTMLSALFLPHTLAAQSSGTPSLHIAGLDTSQFPTIQLAVNLSDTSGNPLPTPSEFTVTINGNPVDSVSVIPAQRQVAVVMVSDLSVRMGDRGTGFSSRFDDMLPRIKALTDQIRTDGHYASLITFDRDVQVPHPLTYDLGAVSNTLNRGNSALIFEPGVSSADSYLLTEALLAGIDQFADADPTAPQALVLFAAGEPTPVELQTLRERLSALREAGRPVRLLVLGFGSDKPDEFNEFPAGPESLRQLAEDLAGTFIGVGIEPLDEATRREIDAQFLAIRNLANQYNLTFTTDAVPSGEATITVSAAGATDSIRFDPGAIPPRFDVIVDTRSFQGEVQITTRTAFKQADLERVEYFLSDLPLDTVTSGPDFALRLNVYESAFQQQFPPGEYVLSAAAFDTNGNQSRSTNTIPITVFPPPPDRPTTDVIIETIQRYWWVGLIIVALAGLALFGFINRSKPSQGAAYQRKPKTESASLVSSDAPTVEHDSSANLTGLHRPPPDATMEYPNPPPDVTIEYKPIGVPTKRFDKRWFVEVIEGDNDKGKRFELNEGRYFSIGRINPTGHSPEFVMENPLITKGIHARLSLLHDGIELLAGKSTNGTFIGNEKNELLPNNHHILKDNDIFWLSRGVKLRVVQEDV